MEEVLETVVENTSKKATAIKVGIVVAVGLGALAVMKIVKKGKAETIEEVVEDIVDEIQ